MKSLYLRITFRKTINLFYDASGRFSTEQKFSFHNILTNPQWKENGYSSLIYDPPGGLLVYGTLG